MPPIQPPEKKKSYKELREEQLAAEAAAKKAAEQPEVRKVLSGKKYALTPSFHFEGVRDSRCESQIDTNKTGIDAYFSPMMFVTGDQ